MKAAGRAAAGGVIALAVLAALAPCLAGARPLLIVSSAGISAPALGQALRWLPSTSPAFPAPEVPVGAWRIDPPVAHDPLAIDLDSRLQPPGANHWLGTDELGRDVLSRLIHGSRPSLLVAAIATLVSLVLGIGIGAAAGYGRAGMDHALSRLIEASLSFPGLVLLLLLTAIALGAPAPAGGADTSVRSMMVVGLAVGIARWGVIARYMRGEILRLSHSDLALSARAAGASPWRILGRHLVPAGIGPVAVSAAFGAGSAVVADASLSFLGMGIQPPAPTWGQMIASASAHGSHNW